MQCEWTQRGRTFTVECDADIIGSTRGADIKVLRIKVGRRCIGASSRPTRQESRLEFQAFNVFNVEKADSSIIGVPANFVYDAVDVIRERSEPRISRREKGQGALGVVLQR